MDINRLTDKTQEALQTAQSEAGRRSHQQVDVEHLLAALLAQKGGLATSILTRAGANVGTLTTRLDQELGADSLLCFRFNLFRRTHILSLPLQTTAEL